MTVLERVEERAEREKKKDRGNEGFTRVANLRDAVHLATVDK